MEDFVELAGTFSSAVMSNWPMCEEASLELDGGIVNGVAIGKAMWLRVLGVELTAKEELRLVRRAQEGDTVAFDRLVLYYQRRFYNLAFRMLGHRDDALEVTQDAFYQMYKNLGRFEAKARFSTWATRIVINLCLNLRKKKRRRKVDFQISMDDPGRNEDRRPLSEVLPTRNHRPDQRLHGTEIARALQDGLEQLSDMHRQILVLRDVQGYSYVEIASTLEITEGTVKSRLSRARTALKEYVKKWL